MLVVVSITGEREGNRSTKLYLGTYLTSLSIRMAWRENWFVPPC